MFRNKHFEGERRIPGSVLAEYELPGKLDIGGFSCFTHKFTFEKDVFQYLIYHVFIEPALLVPV